MPLRRSFDPAIQSVRHTEVGNLSMIDERNSRCGPVTSGMINRAPLLHISQKKNQLRNDISLMTHTTHFQRPSLPPNVSFVPITSTKTNHETRREEVMKKHELQVFFLPPPSRSWSEGKDDQMDQIYTVIMKLKSVWINLKFNQTDRSRAVESISWSRLQWRDLLCEKSSTAIILKERIVY